MTVEILPSRAEGTVGAPPSKSMTHRALIAAALADGVSTVDNVAPSEDILATIDCLRSLGARIDYANQTAVVTGMQPALIPNGAVLPCRESGTTLRLLIPLVLTSGKRIAFTGSNRLFTRPLSIYADICRAKDLRFELGGSHLTVQGMLPPGTYTVPGDISSQFISGLCLALPLLNGESNIVILPPVESRSYIEMTVQALGYFGVRAVLQNDHILIPGGQRYHPCDCRIEGDWSNAAFLDALNLLGGKVAISGLSDESCQGDRVYPVFFDALRDSSPTLDLTDCPDLGPVCFALAAALHGATFTGINRLRYKESDRISAMAEELSKFGTELYMEDDSVAVSASALHKPDVPLCSHNDHRVAMALSVLATQTGGVISDAEAVCKSYPDFYDVLERLGIRLIRHF